jgi:hypothetical protein
MRYPDKALSGGNPSCEPDPAFDVERQLRHAGRAARSILVRRAVARYTYRPPNAAHSTFLRALPASGLT